MNKTQYAAIAGMALALSSTALTHDEKANENSPWDGSNAQVGLTANSGNTQTTDINTGLNVNYAKHKWKNVFNFTTQIQKNGGETSKEKYFAQNQTNFNFGDSYNQFIFLNANTTMDKQSPYTYQIVGAAGYGLDLIDKEKFKWSIQAGPGFRTNKNRSTNTSEDKYATTAQTMLDWKMSKNVDLNEALNAIWGQPSNYYKSVTGFTNKITGNIATSVSFTVEHYDKIPPGSKNTHKTDTTTAISIVYNFG